MNQRLFQLHFRMSRLALGAWALGLFAIGTLSVFLVSDTGPSYLPQPYTGSVAFYLVIYALIFSSGCLSSNQRDNMLLTLGSLPIRRRDIALGKSAFFALSTVGLALVGWVGSALGVAIVEADVALHHLAISTLAAYLLVMAAFSYTLVPSALCTNQRTALAFATVMTVFAYLAEVLGSGYEGLQWLASISIFHYYDPSKMLQDGIVDWQGMAILGGVIAVGHLLALTIFARKDLSV